MKQVPYRESLYKTINLREKLDVFIVCHWHGTTHPAWPAQGQRLTPLQALDEYEKCCECADSRWVALKAVSRDGTVFDICALRKAVNYTRAVRQPRNYLGPSGRDSNRPAA
jgi:hypothetical protein